MSKGQSKSLDDSLAEFLEDDWQTAAQVQRLCGGETLEVAKALDRLWGAGLIDRQTEEIAIGARRKGGGAQFRRLRYRRKGKGLAQPEFSKPKAQLSKSKTR